MIFLIFSEAVPFEISAGVTASLPRSVQMAFASLKVMVGLSVSLGTDVRSAD